VKCLEDVINHFSTIVAPPIDWWEINDVPCAIYSETEYLLMFMKHVAQHGTTMQFPFGIHSLISMVKRRIDENTRKQQQDDTEEIQQCLKVDWGMLGALYSVITPVRNRRLVVFK
jgi:hypothetical protein